MTIFRFRFGRLLASVLSVAWLAACQPSGPTGGGAKAATALDAPAASELGRASPGKPEAPIDFHYEILSIPMLGQPVDIRITSSVQPALDALNIALSGDERLFVPAEQARFRMARGAGSARSSRTITVTPMVAGTHYLNVLLRADVDGRAQARAATIRIDVGGARVPPPSTGTISTDVAGQRIISLPAQEN
jgi:hypothetical protein